MLEYFKINGRVWKVRILAVEESFSILDTENAGRVIKDGEMKLDRIGTFFNHKITFARASASVYEFDELFDYLSKPRNSGINVEFVHNQAVIGYKAYVSTGSRKLKRIDTKNGIVYWDTFDASFISMKANGGAVIN